MLTTWLTEIFLNSLGVLKDSGKREEFEQTQKDFRDFLASETLKVGGAGGWGRWEGQGWYTVWGRGSQGRLWHHGNVEVSTS